MFKINMFKSIIGLENILFIGRCRPCSNIPVARILNCDAVRGPETVFIYDNAYFLFSTVHYMLYFMSFAMALNACTSRSLPPLAIICTFTQIFIFIQVWKDIFAPGKSTFNKDLVFIFRYQWIIQAGRNALINKHGKSRQTTVCHHHHR